MAVQHHWRPMGTMPEPYVTSENGVRVLECDSGSMAWADRVRAKIKWLESELDGKEVNDTIFAGCCGCSR